MKNKNLSSFLLWFAFLAIQYLSTYINYPDDLYIHFDTILQNLLYIGIFYLIYHSVFKAYHADKKWLVASTNYILCYIIALFSVHLLFGYFMPIFGNREIYSKGYITINRLLITDVGLNFLQFSLYAFLYWQYNKRVQVEKRLRGEQTEKLALANAKLKTEYDYLKSQINPHFLYNTLDFFYAKMLKLDKPAANGIITLSELMRYSLDTGNENGKVYLTKEVEQIENYITLQQLRFDHALYIEFEYTPIHSNITILPHTLITLVENAFKYGVTDDVKHPLQIQLKIENKDLHFIVRNKISHYQPNRVQTGIGLQNLKNRMDIEYAGQYHYEVMEEGEYYTTVLDIFDLKEIT